MDVIVWQGDFVVVVRKYLRRSGIISKIWPNAGLMGWVNAVAETHMNHGSGDRVDEAFTPAVVATVEPDVLVRVERRKRAVVPMVRVEVTSEELGCA